MSHSIARRTLHLAARPAALAFALALALTACGGSDAAPTVSSVVPLPDALSLAEGEVAPLAAVVLPDPGVGQEVTWTSGNTAVATVAGGGTAWTVRARARGTATLIVTSVQDPTRSATVALTVFKPATLAFEPAAASFVDPVGQVLHTTLRNTGDRPATGVSLSVTFPLGGTGWLTAAPAAGGSLDLAAGASVVLDLTLDPAGLASGLHAAEVAPLADPEVNFSGNAFTVVVRVP